MRVALVLTLLLLSCGLCSAASLTHEQQQQQQQQQQQHPAAASLHLRLSFGTVCLRVQHSSLHSSFFLSVPVQLVSDDGQPATAATLQRLQLHAVSQLNAGAEQQPKVQAMLDGRGGGALLLLCSSFDSCWQLQAELTASPQRLQQSLQLSAVAAVGDEQQVIWQQTPALPSRQLVPESCGRGWVVFQQRVDARLSFRQNWDTYVRGFGSPDGNYWMGLENLHVSTRVSQSYSGHCRLRIEVEAFTGITYRAEWSHFQVRDLANRYALLLNGFHSHSTLRQSMASNSGYRFSTFDRDHDASSAHCSRHYGYGGWWYRACNGEVNLNGIYPTVHSNLLYFASVHLNGRWTPMRKTKMMFKCRE